MATASPERTGSAAARQRWGVALLAPLLVVMWLARASAAPPAVRVSPPPGATLATPPAQVQVTLPQVPPPGSQLQVLDAGGTDHEQGGTAISGHTLAVQVPLLAAGQYTVLWKAGTQSGAATFTVWRGGALPAEATRALRGGPGPAPPARLEGLLVGIALAEAAVAIGGLAYGRKRSVTAQRTAGILLAGTALAAALLRTTAVAGALAAGHLAVGALALHGLPRLDLIAAVAGVLEALAASAAPLAAGLSGVAAIALVASVPALHALGPGALAAALLVFTGVALFAGAWPHARRTQAEPAPALRWLGAALAMAAGAPLLVWWHPLGPAAAATAGALALTAALVGRPGRRRGTWALGAALLGGAALVVVAPALARPSPEAGRPAALPGTALTPSSGPINVRLLLAGGTPGVQTVGARVPGAVAPTLAVHLQSLRYPQLRPTIELARLRPGAYAAVTGALSLPGPWQAKVAGATFAFELRTPTLPEACPPGIAGLPLAQAALGGSVRTIATAADDANVAMAATPTALYATNDGGRHWLPAGHLDGVTAVALGQHGAWFAATASGVFESHDGGQLWSPTAVRAPILALAAPLYPAGLGIWALGAGTVYHRLFQPRFSAPVPTWETLGQGPDGVTTMVTLPAASGGDAKTGLLAATPTGLQWSDDGGRIWNSVSGPAGTITSLAAGPGGIWAAGSLGVDFAAQPAGPWRPVAVGIGSDPAQVAVAASGAVIVDLQLQGIFLRPPGARTFTRVGCWSQPLTALAGTYHSAAPAQDLAAATLAYWGDAQGDLVAVLPTAKLPQP